MDYQWWVYLHVFGAFAFALGHGVSAIMAFRIRASRDATEIRTLLDASGLGLAVMYVGLLLLLVGGIAAGLAGNHFSKGWIWASLGLLVATIVLMYALATPYYRQIRLAVGAQVRDQSPEAGGSTVSPAELEALVETNRPMILAAVGTVGFAVILWLMFFKPF